MLLPVRDARPHLEDALASLLRQTFDDFEIVLQDDGSTDGSLEVAKDVAREDPRMRFEAGPPRGIVAALNAAAARARSIG